MRKIFILVILIFLINCFIVADEVINKIVYKKILIDFDQYTLINVYLNQMDAIDVIVVFNNDELVDVNKNLKPLVKDDNSFYPSFSFEVSNVKRENSLQIFVVLSQGITLNAETSLYFEKGIVVDSNNYQVKKDKYFYVKAGDCTNEEIFYNIQIEDDSVVEKVEEVIKNNILFYKLKCLKTGNTKIEIFKYDQSLDKQDANPVKTVKINASN